MRWWFGFGLTLPIMHWHTHSRAALDSTVVSLFHHLWWCGWRVMNASFSGCQSQIFLQRMIHEEIEWLYFSCHAAGFRASQCDLFLLKWGAHVFRWMWRWLRPNKDQCFYFCHAFMTRQRCLVYLLSPKPPASTSPLTVPFHCLRGYHGNSYRWRPRVQGEGGERGCRIIGWWKVSYEYCCTFYFHETESVWKSSLMDVCSECRLKTCTLLRLIQYFK